MSLSKEVTPSTEVTVIVSHDLDPADAEASAARINGNGARMAEMDGFVGRVLLHPQAGPTDHLTTITRWASIEAYDAWVAHNRANNPNAGIPAPFTSHPPAILTAYER